MDVRPFETIDCEYCKGQFDSEEVWWYRQRSYCPTCYSSYFTTNEREKEMPRTTEVNMVDMDQWPSPDCLMCSTEKEAEPIVHQWLKEVKTFSPEGAPEEISERCQLCPDHRWECRERMWMKLIDGLWTLKARVLKS